MPRNQKMPNRVVATTRKLKLLAKRRRVLKARVRYFVMALVVVGGMAGGGGGVGLTPGGSLAASAATRASAASCPDLKVIFARGSGEERWTDQNYLALKAGLESKLAGTEIGYEFEDLDYPAVGIGNVLTMLGALFGGGEVYKFGRSVNTGVERLVAEVNGACRDTKYVVAGYSQGAMVVSKALRQLDSERVIYAATFGDPKIYLPEGAGAMPIACQGLGLSDYRMYVPDCRAFIGKLGTYLPYRPEGFVGKLGTWCNRMDIFCSSYLSVASHTAYVADNLYEDAARVMIDKITEAFGVENTYVSPHQTAILVDSTGSMDKLIEQYKVEALRLAKETLASGGEVAFYDYRDYKGSNALTKRCDFGCTLEEFEGELAKVEAADGGDTLESTLGAAFTVMNELDWRLGATKSLVILTDAGYHEPDFDSRRTTLTDVVQLSRQIDPVNIYVVTTPVMASTYAELTGATGGRVVTTLDDLTILTDEIMRRYDSLPRVEEWLDDGEELPWVEVSSVAQVAADRATVRFRSSHGRVMVALNDVLLGVVEGGEFTITDLDLGVENVLTLVPISETRSGAPVNVALEASSWVEDNGGLGGAMAEDGGAEGGESGRASAVVPRAPNTGRR